MTEGIYILANDVVYNQMVALLNSIEANAGKPIPVCILPYNEQLDQVRAEIARRKNVVLFENPGAIAAWETFATKAWKSHTRAQRVWRERGLPEVYRLAMHRKLCSFDGPFDKFIYFDADTLLMGPLDEIYRKLDEYDWVTNDYQYASDLKYIFDLPEAELLQVFDAEKLKSHIFCAGWFASKKGVFDAAKLDTLLQRLTAGEAEVMALFGPDQSLFNYMVLRSGISYYNFAYHGQAPGSHWSSQFDEIDHVLYDHGRRLTYLHYMSIATPKFNRLCQGYDTEIPYRDLFLHYRYLTSVEERPQQFKKSSSLSKFRKSITRLINQKAANLQHKLRKVRGNYS